MLPYRIITIHLIVSLLVCASSWAMDQGRPSGASLTLSASDGLSSSLTYDLQKDTDGFLWISNRMGVDRYDGHTFKQYHLSQRADEVLSQDDGKHHHLTYDRQGNLICYTDRGKVFRYNHDTDAYELLYSATSILQRHSLHAAAISGDTLILGLFNGIHIINLTTLQIESHLCPNQNIRTIVPYQETSYLVGSDHGIGMLDLSADTFSTLALQQLDVKSVYFDDEQQRIWLGTNGSGLWTLKADGSEPQQIPHWENTIVTQIQPYGESQLLVGTDGSGVLITSRSRVSSLSLFASDVVDSHYYIPGAGVQSLFVDEDKVWVSTFDRGITLLKPTQSVLFLRASSAVEQRVNDVDADSDGHVWVAYRDAVAEYNLQTGEERVYPLNNPNLLTILAASDGSIWCGGYNSGVFRIDPASRRSSHLPSLDGRTVNSNVYAFLEDTQGRIWVGSQFSPLTCITVSESLPKHQIPDRSQMTTYPISRINDLGLLYDDVIVAATTDGVILLNISNGTTHSILSEVDTCWTGTNYMACLETDHTRHVYIGTDGSGLIIYDSQTGHREQYTSHNGLPSNFIRSIECVDDSILWISTEKEGIFAFSLQSRSVIHQVIRSQGLSTEGFHQDASAQLPNGAVVFGGKGGTEVIYPDQLSSHAEILLFMVSEIGLGQESRLSYKSHPEVLDAPVSQLQRIRLPYGERSLRIAFSAVDLYQNSDLRFVYRIDEDDCYWQALDNHRQLSIYSLPSGQHILTVRCLRGQEIVAEKQLTIDVELSPWLSWPAISCYVLLSLILVASVLMSIARGVQQSISLEKIRFFSSVAHDIRTPLSLVSSPLADLEQYLSPQTPPSLMPLVKRNLKHLNDVVNQLSLFNKDQNRQQLKLEPIQLCEFMSGVQEAYLPMAQHRGLTLEIELPSEPLWVYADLKMLQRVLDNLLGNAFKFTQKGGVRIVVYKHLQRGMIEVIDTGIGMSETTRRKLFNHFFRGENAVNGRIPGFGLGMMYAYQAVLQMKGRLSCQSQEDKGSTFTVQLPVAPAGVEHSYDFTEHVEAFVEQEFRPVYSGYRYDVLVVEDNEELLTYLSEKLGQGYNVMTANCVSNAQLLIQNHHPDLIISDIMMPGMRGDDWCNELKQNIETSHIPLILLTANTDYQSQMKGLNYGADDYITKPFDINMLLMKIRNLFDARRKMQAHYMQVLQQAEPAKGVDSSNPIENLSPTNTESLDDQFVRKLFVVVDRHIANSELTNEMLAAEMAMSHTLFYEKVNKILGLPPASLIRSFRMKKAKQLLQEGEHSVSEVAVMCGFTDAKYFSTAFKKYFGVSPSKV